MVYVHGLLGTGLKMGDGIGSLRLAPLLGLVGGYTALIFLIHLVTKNNKGEVVGIRRAGKVGIVIEVARGFELMDLPCLDQEFVSPTVKLLERFLVCDVIH